MFYILSDLPPAPLLQLANFLATMFGQLYFWSWGKGEPFGWGGLVDGWISNMSEIY